MTLTPGQRLGPYEVLALIGEGAMGHVYKARDDRLGRDVAIKTSKVSFDERFQREAQAIAALNHAHVCTIYDVGADYLVMEYVEGESLSERLARGPLRETEAIELALQIAAGLEAAHSRGIVHRDLKPANIRITREGEVKVVDFGLAKIGADATPVAETRDGTMTEAGTVIGTPAYMAPEQARAQPIDHRADIWALGVVFWEMLTGRRPFGGATTTDVLAAVLTHEPKWTDVPERFRPLLRRCLAKDPRQRLRDAGDARLWLEEPAAVTQAPASRRRVTSTWAAWTAIVALVVAGATAVAVLRRPAVERAPSMRFSINPPPGVTLVGNGILRGDISPDGLFVLFRGSSAANEGRLYLHALESNSTRLVEGTDSTTAAFFSPDGRSIAFVSGGKLKSTPLTGGPLQVLCDAPGPGVGDWGRDGTILLALDDGIWRVSERGGEKQRVTTIDLASGESAHLSPRFLPDGKRFLYLITHADTSRTGIYVGAFDNPSGRSFVGAALGKVVYVPAANGEPSVLVYVRDQLLVAQPFDDSAAKLVGQPGTLVGPVATAFGLHSSADAMVSPAGVLAFRIAEAAAARRLMWLSREGARLGEVPQAWPLTSFFLSPDDARVSVDVRAPNGRHDVKTFDFGRNVLSPQTSHTANDFLAVWSPDGRRLVFGSSRLGVSQLYLTTVGGGSSEEQITTGPAPKYPLQWTEDGRYVLFRHQTRPDGGFDLWAVPVDGDRKPFPVVESVSSKFTGQISPDGQWIAYQAAEGDASEIYVQSFPTTAFKVQVSNKGGRWPKWVETGNRLELFYVSSDNEMTVVELTRQGNELQPRTPTGLFRIALPLEATYPYDVTSDGRRLLVSEQVSSPMGPLEILTNWRSLMQK